MNWGDMLMDKDRLTGKNILITGAAQGMGATNAEHFAEQGANVCLGDLDLDLAQTVAERINERGNGKAIAVKMDVTKREDNASAVAATVDAFGMINVGLFNAGVNKPRFFMDIDEDNWDNVGFDKDSGVLIREDGKGGHIYFINSSTNSTRCCINAINIYTL